MSKPVYEIPIGDESYPPAPGRRSASNPPPAPFGSTALPTPDAAPGYLSAPPPGQAPAFDPAAGFPPPTFAPPTFAPSSYDPPSYVAPTYDPPVFDGSVFEAPAPAFASPEFDRPAFDSTAYAAPATSFDSAAYPPPPPAPTSPPNYEGTPYTFEAPAPLPSYSSPPALTATSTMQTAAPAAPVVDRSPQVGEGQLGSEPDIVAALNAVVTNRASDLHVTAGSAPMIRVDGGLRPLADTPVWDHDMVAKNLHSIMSERQLEEFESDLELDFAYQLSPTARFRVNIYQQRDHLGAAFRLIPTEIKQLNTLGVPEQIGKFAQLARGLVLVTGPTGSGKSTTLAALVDLVNSTRADHIVTVEDPIEFMHENKKSLVNQREVGHDTHSFANALKHVLRQDPDVILIGELRDLETISVALTAAETGHLVFATLHTQDAAQTIDRVIDVFPPHQQGQVRAQLAATLQGVVSQTLVKRVGGGRAVATEVLVTTPAISNLIREGKTYQINSAMQAGRDLGMHTMDQHLADLVNAGQISHQSAYDKAHSLEDLKQLIQRAAADSSAGVSHGRAF